MQSIYLRAALEATELGEEPYIGPSAQDLLGAANSGPVFEDGQCRRLFNFTFPRLVDSPERLESETNRPHPDDDCVIIVEVWLREVLRDLRSTPDLAAIDRIMPHFLLIRDVLTCMPRQLSPDSWPGKILQMMMFPSMENLVLHEGKVCEHRVWNADLSPFKFGDGVYRPLVQNVNFVGEPKDGYLVCIPTDHTALTNTFRVETEFFKSWLKLYHEILVAAAAQFADGLFVLLSWAVCRSRGTLELSYPNFRNAVREILGTDWFELPFDTESKLSIGRFDAGDVGSMFCIQWEDGWEPWLAAMEYHQGDPELERLHERKAYSTWRSFLAERRDDSTRSWSIATEAVFDRSDDPSADNSPESYVGEQ
ncbi:hypothetical protein H2203_005512 [Taxawa tesnikishii (nom. ined.)]|nr:hypothetical protein H2203_005512 [Dothideales sp. JES 119]